MFLPAILYVGTIPAGTSLPSGASPPLGQRPHRPDGKFRVVPGPLPRVSGSCTRRRSATSTWSSARGPTCCGSPPPGIRNFVKMDIRKVYYTLLVIFLIWGLTMMNVAIAADDPDDQRQRRQFHHGNLRDRDRAASTKSSRRNIGERYGAS